MRQVQLSPEEERARQVLDAVRRVLNLTDAEVGRRLGVSYQAIQQRRTGATRMRYGDIQRIAAALDVDPAVFAMEPPDAIQWVLDHRRDLLVPSSCSMFVTAA